MTALASVGLMLRHEARLNWRSSANYASSKAKITGLVCFVFFMHLMGAMVPLILMETPAIPRSVILAAATGMGLVTLLLMMSGTLLGTVTLIYSRDDMDLLLSSPVPPFAIVTTRVLAIALGVFGIAGVFLLPFANMMAAFGHLRFLSGYVVLACLALTATALGMLVAQVMFSLFGARRTRLFAQILVALVGLALVCSANLRLMLPDGAAQSFMQMLTDLAAWLPGPDSLIWWPARAALGEPMPVVVVAVLSVGLFVLTTHALANRLMASAVAANGAAAKTVKTRSSGMLNADRGPITVMRGKEWLLIARDPWLMTQIAKQLIIMVPSLLVLWQMGASVYAWLGLVVLVGQLAGPLAWLTVSTEDAADLLATAPVRRADLDWAKLQAALIPTAVIMAAPLAAVFMSGIAVGFTVLACSIGNAVSVVLYHLRHNVPAKRSQIGRRGDAKQMHALFELGISLVWIVLGLTTLVFGWWGVLAFVVLAPAAVWMVR